MDGSSSLPFLDSLETKNGIAFQNNELSIAKLYYYFFFTLQVLQAVGLRIAQERSFLK